MTHISDIFAQEILDSPGNPTIEVEVCFDERLYGSGRRPLRSLDGQPEARELRDGDKTRFGGKGVLHAVPTSTMCWPLSCAVRMPAIRETSIGR